MRKGLRAGESASQGNAAGKALAGWRRWLLLAGLSCLPALATADPWIAPGDALLRHHLEVLADSGIIRTPITTWPLLWSAVADDLRQVRGDSPDSLSQASLAYVRAAYVRANPSGAALDVRFEAGPGPAGFRSFDDSRRARDEASVGVAVAGSRLAGRAQVTVVDAPVDGKTWRPDGSYLSAFAGNWALSAGWQDRWWGPGWQTSLILSDNARPLPALSLSRARPDPFRTPWLAWLGPWQLSSFIGQLDGPDRFVYPGPAGSGSAHAKLVGARLSFRPLAQLEFGLSRAFQWGGDGHPASLSSLLHAAAGHTLSGNTAAENAVNHGIMEAGYDARWSFATGGAQNALYAQMTGQNANGDPPLPSRFTYLAGLESAFATGGWQHRLVLEAARTDADGFGAAHNVRSNYVYEGSYAQGYRYEGLPLGASLDNDSRMLALQGEHLPPDAALRIHWMLAYLDVNDDGGNVALPGGSRYGGNTRTPYATLACTLPVATELQLSAGLQYYRKPLRLDGEKIGSGLVTGLRYAF